MYYYYLTTVMKTFAIGEQRKGSLGGLQTNYIQHYRHPPFSLAISWILIYEFLAVYEFNMTLYKTAYERQER